MTPDSAPRLTSRGMSPPPTQHALPSPADRHLWQITPVRDLLWGGGLLFLLWFGYYLRGVFTPVLIALLLAYLFNPLIRRAEDQWRIPRPVTISVILLLSAMLMLSLITWLGPLLAEQVQSFAERVPGYIQSIATRYHVRLGDFSEHLSTIATSLRDDPLSILRPVFSGTGQAFGLLGTVIGTTTDVVIAFILIPIYFFFFAWHFDHSLERTTRYIPSGSRTRVRTIVTRMDQAVSGFFRGRLTIALGSAVLYSFGWALTGIRYWFLLGLITGILTIIPYASLIGWPLAVLLKYLDVLAAENGTFDLMTIVVWPSLAYLVVQLIESWLLTPWVQSHSMEMSAVTVLIVVFIGGALGGFYGLLLAIPVAACLKILAEELVLPHLARRAAEPSLPVSSRKEPL
ncbi:MAG: AI-2E family transporter [Nitrospira sp.]|nr:AI-2E family transporter [Nitrospira sp.]